MVNKVGNKNIEFTEDQIEKLFEELISGNIELENLFKKYLEEKHPESGATNYVDIGEISNYITSKIIIGETASLDLLFEKIENVLTSCDNYIENLIVVGLFEGIQNPGKVEYYFGFDKWLKPISKTKWNNLIDFWEGEDWRNKK